MVQGLYYINDYQTTKTNRVIAEYHSALINPNPEFYSIYINFSHISSAGNSANSDSNCQFWYCFYELYFAQGVLCRCQWVHILPSTQQYGIRFTTYLIYLSLSIFSTLVCMHSSFTMESNTKNSYNFLFSSM